MTPMFGTTIRGCRLGYSWSNRHQAFIRISVSGCLIRVDIAPAERIPNDRRGDPSEFKAWWDDPQILELSDIRNLRQAKVPFTIFLDNEGRYVAPANLSEDTHAA